MRYTETHEWVKIVGKEGVIGISAHAQKELGDVVYIEFPQIGAMIEQGQEMAVIESTKAAADVYAPVSGRVVAINEKLKEDLSLLNTSPEQEGWLCKLALTNREEVDELLTSSQYTALFSSCE